MTPNPVAVTGGHLSALDRAAVWGMKNPKSKVTVCLITGLVAGALCTIPFLGPLNTLRSVAAFAGAAGLASVSTYYGVFKLPSSKAKITQIIFNSCWEKIHQLSPSEKANKITFRALITALARAVFAVNEFKLDRILTGCKKNTDRMLDYAGIYSDLEKFITDLPSSQFIEQPIAQELDDEELIIGYWPRLESDSSEIVQEIRTINSQKSSKDYTIDQQYSNMRESGIASSLYNEAAQEKEDAIAALKSRHWPSRPESIVISDQAAQAAIDLFLS